MSGTEIADLVTLLMKNPFLGAIFGGGSIVGSVIAIYAILLKGYKILQKSFAGDSAILNGFTTQNQIIDLLRQEITRLNDETQKLRNDLAVANETCLTLMNDNAKLHKEL